jgi:hypothetical protein
MILGTKLGAIYVYKDPATSLPVYVGSVQDGDIMRRHRRHLVIGKSRFERWLLSCPEPRPSPEQIETVQFENAVDLFAREEYWLNKLQTNVLAGGLNVVKAQGRPDHAEIGAIGGRMHQKMVESGHLVPHTLALEVHVAGGRASWRNRSHSAHLAAAENARKRNVLYGSPSTPEGNAKGGRASGYLHMQNGTGVCAPGVAAKAGQIGGPIACHVRWHVKRGITNLNCILCKGQDNAIES